MAKKYLYDLLKATAGGVVGVAFLYYGSKILERSTTEAEIKEQSLIDEQLNRIEKGLQSLLDKSDAINNSGVNIPLEECNKLSDNLGKVLEIRRGVINNTDVTKDITTESDEAVNILLESMKMLEVWLGKGKNFLPDFSIKNLYDFLDTLTLLEESAFLHIFMFIYILCCVANIISVLFGNEIIRYFNLEERFPKLSIYFKLRSKFQKYYLAWNIFGIIAVSLFAIGLNLLVFYVKL